MYKTLLTATLCLLFTGAANAACYLEAAEVAARELLEDSTMLAALEEQEYLTYVREQTCWLMTEYGKLLETDYAGMLKFTEAEHNKLMELSQTHKVDYLHILAAAEEILSSQT